MSLGHVCRLNIALNPTHLIPIRKGVLSLKKNPVSSTATQVV
jgi:hypothetical protein